MLPSKKRFIQIKISSTSNHDHGQICIVVKLALYTDLAMCCVCMCVLFGIPQGSFYRFFFAINTTRQYLCFCQNLKKKGYPAKEKALKPGALPDVLYGIIDLFSILTYIA